MRNFFRTSLTSIFLMVFANIFGQATIEIEAFNFKSSPAKDTIVSFPEGNDQYEKIIMEYTMRCKNGLISTTSDRNKGCGEWTRVAIQASLILPEWIQLKLPHPHTLYIIILMQFFLS